MKRALDALNEELRSAASSDLIKAQKALEKSLTEIKKRVRLNGDDPLLNAMVHAAKKVSKQRLFLSSLTVNISQRTENMDHSDNSVEGSVDGKWFFHGKT